MSKGFKLTLLLSTFILVSCASRESGWTRQGQQINMSASEQKALREEAMQSWKKRANKDDLESALMKFETLSNSNPKDIESLIYLTRGHYLLADGHLDNPDQKKLHYEKATSFGEMAMATNDAFKTSVSSGKSVEESLGTLTAQEVPAIYWSAASLGKWAKAQGIATQLKYKTRIKAQIQQVEKLQPGYFYSAPARFWGAFYAVAPSFAGGDLKKSKTYFEKSLSEAPEYLGTKVLMAETYFVKMSDQKSFEKTLREVLESKEDKHPELGPENMLEKKKAEKLLESSGDLF